MASKKPPNSEWTLTLNRDYIDATTFGDLNKKYLVAGPKTWTLTGQGDPYTTLGTVAKQMSNTIRTGKNGAIYLRKNHFDYHSARKMYEDDPVVLAIIDRMEGMEP